MNNDRFEFGLQYREGMAWVDYLELLERERLAIDLPAGRVAATFRIADVDGEIVGRVSIRHALNEFLARERGHIGYGVLPHVRRRGYATESITVDVREEGPRLVGVPRPHLHLGAAGCNHGVARVAVDELPPQCVL
jgi:predicted acetyltransferase